MISFNFTYSYFIYSDTRRSSQFGSWQHIQLNYIFNLRRSQFSLTFSCLSFYLLSSISLICSILYISLILSISICINISFYLIWIISIYFCLSISIIFCFYFASYCSFCHWSHWFRLQISLTLYFYLRVAFYSSFLCYCCCWIQQLSVSVAQSMYILFIFLYSFFYRYSVLGSGFWATACFDCSKLFVGILSTRVHTLLARSLPSTPLFIVQLLSRADGLLIWNSFTITFSLTYQSQLSLILFLQQHQYLIWRQFPRQLLLLLTCCTPGMGFQNQERS